MPSKKKRYNARFPAGRIKKIMQTDDEVGKVAQAVPVIISRTLELFVQSLIAKTMEITTMKNARTLSPHHMKQCILSESRFDFLKDLVKSVPEVSTSDTDDNWNENSAPGSSHRRVSTEEVEGNFSGTTPGFPAIPSTELNTVLAPRLRRRSDDTSDGVAAIGCSSSSTPVPPRFYVEATSPVAAPANVDVKPANGVPASATVEPFVHVFKTCDDDDPEDYDT